MSGFDGEGPKVSFAPAWGRQVLGVGCAEKIGHLRRQLVWGPRGHRDSGAHGTCPRSPQCVLAHRPHHLTTARTHRSGTAWSSHAPMSAPTRVPSRNDRARQLRESTFYRPPSMTLPTIPSLVLVKSWDYSDA